ARLVVAHGLREGGPLVLLLRRDLELLVEGRETALDDVALRLGAGRLGRGRTGGGGAELGLAHRRVGRQHRSGERGAAQEGGGRYGIGRANRTIGHGLPLPRLLKLCLKRKNRRNGCDRPNDRAVTGRMSQTEG